MPELIPAVLAPDEATFRERVKMMEGVAPVIHLDVMDGAFVPNRTWFDPMVIGSLQTPVRFELHLMVNDPQRYIEEIKDLEAVIRAMWHVEVAIDHRGLIDRCHALRKQAGLAINPMTPIDMLVPYAGALDEILVMGADPGFSGKAMDPNAIARTWEIHGRWPEIPLGFDIGVKDETIPQLKRAGISRFCAAGAIFGSPNPVAEAKKLQGLIS